MRKIFSIASVVTLVCLVGLLMVACYPSSVASAIKKMSNAGYTVTEIALATDTSGNKISGGFRATKLDTVSGTIDEIIAVKYVKGGRADEAYFDIWDVSKEFGFAWSGFTTRQYNDWIYGGTDVAITIFKG